MTTFDDMVRDQAMPLLEAQHGEEVEVTPAGGATTTVTAIVDRSPLDENQFAREDQPIVTLRLQHLNPLTVNADKIALRKRPDDAALTEFTVTRVISKTQAFWRLGLR